MPQTNSKVTNQYILIKSIFELSIYVLDLYFMVLIYKNTNDIKMLIVYMLFNYVFLMISFVSTSFLISKTSLNTVFRIGFFILVLVGIYGIFGNYSSLSFYMIFASFRGFGEGLYWTPSNIIELQGLNKDTRSKLYSFSAGLSKVIYIIIPVIIGNYLFKNQNYQIIFLIFSILNFLGLCIEWNFPKLEGLTLKNNNFKRILSNKNFSKFVLLRSITSGWSMIAWLVSSIIPFVILGNEKNMGIYLTLSTLIGAIIAFFSMNLSLIRKRLAGFIMLIISTLSKLLLAFSFTPLYLFSNSVVENITSSITSPAEYDLFISATEIIKGKNNVSMELILIQEVIYTIARLFFGLILFFVIYLKADMQTLLFVAMILECVLRMVQYFVYSSFTKKDENKEISLVHLFEK